MINNVVLIGRLTKDLELRYTTSGTAVGTFNLAVNRAFKNANGEREADFINCVIWKKGAENLANFTQKGSQIGISGRLQTRNYENNQGQRVYVTEVVVDNFSLLDKRSETNQLAEQNQQQAVPRDNSFTNQQPNNHNPFGGGTEIDISDDDLPF